MYVRSAATSTMSLINFRRPVGILQKFSIFRTKNSTRSPAQDAAIQSFTKAFPLTAGIFSIFSWETECRCLIPTGCPPAGIFSYSRAQTERSVGTASVPQNLRITEPCSSSPGGMRTANNRLVSIRIFSAAITRPIASYRRSRNFVFTSSETCSAWGNSVLASASFLYTWSKAAFLLSENR